MAASTIQRRSTQVATSDGAQAGRVQHGFDQRGQAFQPGAIGADLRREITAGLFTITGGLGDGIQIINATLCPEGPGGLKLRPFCRLTSPFPPIWFHHMT